jgi:type II secretory pathway component GspD/PulD (secretin)
MKTTTQHLATLGLTLALVTSVAAQDSKASKSTKAPPTKSTSAKKAVEPPAPPEKAEIQLNFRNAPLDMVLTYLSKAAGYTVFNASSVRGTVDVFNEQPVTKTQALEIVNTALAKNGFGVIIEGNNLTVYNVDEMKQKNIPVKRFLTADDVAKDDVVVTAILPLRAVSAAELMTSLQTLMPTSATISTSQSANSIIMTDKRSNIRHIMEIIHELDDPSTQTLKVFPLNFADAAKVAQTIKDLFTTDSRSSGASPFGRGGFSGFGGGGPGGFSGFGGGGGPGGFSGFGGGGPGGGFGGPSGFSSRGSSSGGSAAARVSATADEYSNSVIVSAGEAQMAAITELIAKIDIEIDDLTEIRIFTLRNADPSETANQLTTLFPDPTRQNNNSRTGGSPFGGTRFGGSTSSRGSTSTSGATSERAKKQGKVTAVADQRTRSVIVSASRDMMVQVDEMIQRLDSDTGRNQKVRTFGLVNANTSEVETVLRTLFESQSSSRSRSTSSQQQDPFNTRANNANQNLGRNTTTGGSTGGGIGGRSGSFGGTQ